MFRSMTVLSLCAWLVMPASTVGAAHQSRESFDSFQIGPAGSLGRQATSPKSGTPRVRSVQHLAFQSASATLLQLVQVVYELPPVRVRATTAPRWVSETKWQIWATSSEANIPYSRVRSMLRNSLIEHFELVLEKPKRPLPVLYVTLDISRDRSNLRRAPKRADCVPFLDGTKWLGDAPKSTEGLSLCGLSSSDPSTPGPLVHFRSAPLSAFGRNLERALRHVVIVEPENSELFDIDFQYPQDYIPGGPAMSVDAFMDALEQQFGARVAIRTSPVEVVELVGARQSPVVRIRQQ